MKKIFFPLLLVFFSIWLIYDDIPYLWMFSHEKEIIQTQGVVTKKYKKGRSQIRGGSAMDYLIEIQGINGNCSGTSKISKKKYEKIRLNDEIKIRRYKENCLANFDIRMYAPPTIHFFSSGLILFLSLFYLLNGVRQVLRDKNKAAQKS